MFESKFQTVGRVSRCMVATKEGKRPWHRVTVCYMGGSIQFTLSAEQFAGVSEGKDYMFWGRLVGGGRFNDPYAMVEGVRECEAKPEGNGAVEGKRVAVVTR